MQAADGDPGGPSLVGVKVLAVEDEAVIALDLERTLRELGCVVLGPAASVSDALTFLGRERPDAVLLDLRLSDGRATPVAEALRSAGVPFAVVTGLADGELDEPALRDAPRLGKPYGTEGLRRTLLRTLGRPGLTEKSFLPDPIGSA